MANDIRFTVVRGRPDEAELAAVTAVLLAVLRAGQEAGPGAGEPLPPRAGWGRAHGPRRSPVGWSTP
ncbi:acyl-CoA carboxylase subunit epsilon [Streptomyces hygroscopicus]|uniref:acyl-CoA carboxylase subunit epsilon n=1 Tax=Streptomyces hygroscopicus TaxID=1912 RepID=UPI001FCC1C02|nr:acyl-CoA carboxylase subunit epsilon [Streptomyces hygroscopicus]